MPIGRHRPSRSQLANCSRRRGSSSSGRAAAAAAAGPRCRSPTTTRLRRRHDQPHDAVAGDDGLQPLGALRERPAVHAVRADLHLGQPVPLARPVRRREGREVPPVRGPVPQARAARLLGGARGAARAGEAGRAGHRAALARDPRLGRVGRGADGGDEDLPALPRRRRRARRRRRRRRPPAHRARPPVVAGARGVRERADEPQRQLVALRQVPPAPVLGGRRAPARRPHPHLPPRAPTRRLAAGGEVRNSGAIRRSSAQFFTISDGPSILPGELPRDVLLRARRLRRRARQARSSTRQRTTLSLRARAPTPDASPPTSRRRRGRAPPTRSPPSASPATRRPRSRRRSPPSSSSRNCASTAPTRPTVCARRRRATPRRWRTRRRRCASTARC